jgi:hypothetical protein
MTRPKLLTAALLLFVCGTASLAADSPLALFSSDADVVIRLKGLQPTVEKAAATAAAVDPAYGDQVRNFAPFLGITISNPTLAGVDQKQDWYVAVFAHEDSDPEVLFAIPSNDTAAFEEALPKKLTRFSNDGWVFYSEQAEAVERIKAGKPAREASLESEISEQARKVFDGGDLSVFINADHLTQVYRKQIEAAGDELANGQARVPGVPGLPAGNLGDLAEKSQSFLQDSRSVTLALVFNATGINLESYLDFRPDSDMARLLDSHAGNSLATVSQLPADSLLYLGLNGGLFGGAEKLMGAAAAAPKADPETQRKLESLQKAMAEVKYQSLAFDFSLGEPETGLIRSVGIVEATPVAKVREFARESTALMNVKADESGVEVEAEYESEAETVGDHKVDVQSLRVSVDPNVNPFGGIVEQAMTMLCGPDGAQTRYVYWDDKYLQSIGGGPDALAASLERIDGGQSNATPEHRQELLAEPDLLLLIDLQRIIRAALKAADASPNIPIPVDQKLISGDDPPPSYVGFTLATEADAVRTKLQLPGQQIQAIVKFALFARTLPQLMQGR